jgi:hypothetical protein
MASHTFAIEAGNIAMFRRSLGEEVGYVADAIAPLTFTQAATHADPESPLRPHAGQPWRGSGRTPSGTAPGEGWLHAEQHFEYARPLRAGETVRVDVRPGREWTKTSSSGGTLAFAEEITEFRDHDGQVIVTSRIVRVRRVGRTEQ